MTVSITPSSAAAAPRILILLATYNGARYLERQLASLAAQDVDHLDIIASDDGSSDGTLDMLHRWQSGWTKGSFEIVAGPCRGFAENFRHLVALVPRTHDFVAFCDQDDIWYPTKLSRAVTWHLTQDPAMPALYGARTQLIDVDDRELGHSPLFTAPPSFRNALVQSLAGGNTMVLNAAGMELVRQSLELTAVLMHDWWAYLIVSGAGGPVHYDPEPVLGYRQHPGNAIGGTVPLLARPKRLIILLNGRYSEWNAINLAALNRCRALLNADALAVIEDFERARGEKWFTAVRHMRKAGLYRQTPKGHFAMLAGAFFQKF